MVNPVTNNNSAYIYRRALKESEAKLKSASENAMNKLKRNNKHIKLIYLEYNE
jgi:hypothetical protein